MKAASLLRRTVSAVGNVLVFFAAAVPLLVEEGGVPVPAAAVPLLRWSNVALALLLGLMEWRRLRSQDRPLRFLREEIVDYGLLGAVLLVAVEEFVTGGAILGLAGPEALIVPSKAYILSNMVLRIVRLFRHLGRARLGYAKVFLASFLVVIGAGTILLWAFPGAVRPGQKVSFVDALFTSVSAVCVTGLAAVDTSAVWSRFGHVVILILVQIGGLGLMTFAAFFAVALGKGIGFTDRMMLRDMLNVDPLNTIGRVLAGTVTVTIVCEGLGAAAMYGRFHDPADPGTLLAPADQAFYAVFHSVSAFCNAGFALYPDNWTGFAGSPIMSGTIILLILLGGLGFTVLLNLLGLFDDVVHAVRKRLRRRPLTEDEELAEERREPRRVSLQTKVVLGVSAMLVFGGALLFWVFERHWVLEGKGGTESLLACLFQSVSTRTAGFNTVDIARLQPVTLYLFVFLMFIGASPGSTGGGIKTVTAAVLVRSVTSLARGRSRVEMHRRSLPPEVVAQAVVVVVLSLLAVFFGSLLLVLCEGPLLRGERGAVEAPFLAALFECVSAFGTVGLSAGVTGGLTPHLGDLSKIILMLLMFFGRVGPLSLVVAMGRKTSPAYEYPSERVMIG